MTEVRPSLICLRSWYSTIPDHTAVVFKDKKRILTENWMRSVTDLENISHPRELAVKMLFPF